jgi:hypothetical protein
MAAAQAPFGDAVRLASTMTLGPVERGDDGAGTRAMK